MMLKKKSTYSRLNCIWKEFVGLECPSVLGIVKGCFEKHTLNANHSASPI